MARRIVWFLLVFLVCERLTYWKTGGFRTHKICTTLPREEGEAPPPEIEELLGQSFSFLGSGKQFYAFESADKKIVLKFFKYNRRKKIEELVESCRLAYDSLQRETGLIYAHLNEAKDWNREMTLIDAIGIRHRVDLKKTQFLIQKKMSLFCASFPSDVEEGKKRIDALLNLVVSQCLKGISNHDPVLARNVGVLEGRTLLIDFGSLKKNDKLQTPHGFKWGVVMALLEARDWIQQKHPDLLHYFDEQVKNII